MGGRRRGWSWGRSWGFIWGLALVGGCTTAPADSDDGGTSGTPPATSTDGGPDGSPDGPTTDQPGATSQGTAGGASTGPGGGSDGPGPLPVKFDLGGIPDSPPYESQGCLGIDFLFVVDNSGSMSAQQTQLLNSYQGFIDAIVATLDDQNTYHVGVVTSDNYTGNQPGCTTLGDLVTQTAGFGSSNTVCTPFAEGNRFATEQDDLSVAFPCIAQVGTSGSGIEQPVTGTIAALDPARLGPGGCNEGFIRDDAILVVIILTDDPPWAPDVDDAHPTTVTTGWHDAVLAAKNGDPEALVVIGFIPWMNTSCVFQNIESPNLIGFIDSFGDQGVKASICEPDFGPIFASTIETIETTCTNFVPSG